MANKPYLTLLFVFSCLLARGQKFFNVSDNGKELKNTRDYFISQLSHNGNELARKDGKHLCERLVRQAGSTTDLLTSYYGCWGCYNTYNYYYAHPEGSLFDYGTLEFQIPNFNNDADPLSPGIGSMFTNTISYNSSNGIYFDSAYSLYFLDYMSCGAVINTKQRDSRGHLTKFNQHSVNPGCSDSVTTITSLETNVEGHNIIDSAGRIAETFIYSFDTFGHSDTSYRRIYHYSSGHLVEDSTFTLRRGLPNRWQFAATYRYFYSSAGLLDSLAGLSFDTATTTWSPIIFLDFTYTSLGQLMVMNTKKYSRGVLRHWRDSLGYSQPYYTYRKSGLITGRTWDTAAYSIEYKHINSSGLPDSVIWYAPYYGAILEVGLEILTYDVYMQPTESISYNYFYFPIEDTFDMKTIYTYETYISDCPVAVPEMPVYASGNAVFPNPATNKINFKISAIPDERDLNVIITDIYGRVVSRESYYFNRNEKEIDIKQLSTGQYIVAIYDNNQPLLRSVFVKW